MSSGGGPPEGNPALPAQDPAYRPVRDKIAMFNMGNSSRSGSLKPSAPMRHNSARFPRISSASTASNPGPQPRPSSDSGSASSTAPSRRDSGSSSHSSFESRHPSSDGGATAPAGHLPPSPSSEAAAVADEQQQQQEPVAPQPLLEEERPALAAPASDDASAEPPKQDDDTDSASLYSEGGSEADAAVVVEGQQQVVGSSLDLIAKKQASTKVDLSLPAAVQQSAVSALTCELHAANTRAEAGQAAAAAAKQEAAALAGQLQQSQGEAAQLNSRLTAAGNLQAATEGTITAAAAEVLAAQQLLPPLVQQLHTLVQQVQEYQRKASWLTGELQVARRLQAAADGDAAYAAKQVSRVEQQLQGVQQRVVQLEQQLEATTQQLSEKAQAAARLQALNAGLTAELGGITSAYKALEGELSEVVHDRAALQDKVLALVGEVTKLGHETAALKAQLASSKPKQWRKAHAALYKDHMDLTHRYDELQAAMDAMQAANNEARAPRTVSFGCQTDEAALATAHSADSADSTDSTDSTSTQDLQASAAPARVRSARHWRRKAFSDSKKASKGSAAGSSPSASSTTGSTAVSGASSSSPRSSPCSRACISLPKSAISVLTLVLLLLLACGLVHFSTSAGSSSSTGLAAGSAFSLTTAVFVAAGTASPLTTAAFMAGADGSIDNSTTTSVTGRRYEPAGVAFTCPPTALQSVLAGQADSSAVTAHNVRSPAAVPACQLDCGATPWNASAPAAAAPADTVLQLHCPSYAGLLPQSWSSSAPSDAQGPFMAACSNLTACPQVQSLPPHQPQQQQGVEKQQKPGEQATPAAGSAGAPSVRCRQLSPAEQEAVKVAGVLGAIALQVPWVWLTYPHPSPAVRLAAQVASGVFPFVVMGAVGHAWAC